MTVQLHFNADDSKALLSIENINKGLNRLGLAANNTQKNVAKAGNFDSKNSIKNIDAMTRSMQSLDRTAKSTIASMKALAVSAAAFAGISFGLKGFVEAGDSVTKLESKLALVVGRGGELEYVRDTLYDISQASGTSVQGAIDMFNRLGMTLGDQYSADEIINAVEAIQYAAKVSGGAGESLNAAMIQLSQGLASGELRGEELNSVLEQAPRIALAIADGMGIPFGKLRELAKDGQLTSSVVLEAITSQLEILKEEAALMGTTVSSGFQVFNDGLTLFIGKLDQAVGFTSFLGNGLKTLGTVLAEMSKGITKDIETLSMYFTIATEVVKVISSITYEVVFEPILASFKNMVNGVVSYSYNLLSGVVAPLQAFYDFVANLFNQLYMYIIGNSVYRDLIDGIVAYTQDLWARVKAYYETFKNGVSSVFNNLFTIVGNKFNQIGTFFLNIFERVNLKDTVVKFLKENLEAPISAFKMSTRLGASFTASLLAAFATFKANSPALNAITDAYTQFSSTLNKNINDTINYSKGVYNANRALGNSMLYSLKQAIVVPFSSLRLVKDITNDFQAIYKSTTEVLKSVGNNILNFIKENKFSKALSEFMNKNFADPFNTFKVSRKLGASLFTSLKAAFSVFKTNSPIAKSIFDSYRTFSKTLESIFKNTYNKAKGVYTANRYLGNSILTSVKQSILVTLKSFKIVQDGIKAFYSVYEKASDLFSKFSKGIKTLFSFELGALKDPIGLVKSTFSNLSKYLSNFLDSPMKSIGNAYTSGIAYLNNKIDEGANLISTTISKSLSDVLLVGTLGAIALAFEGSREVLFSALKRLILFSFLPLLNNTVVLGVIGLWSESIVSYMISSINDQATRMSAGATKSITDALFIKATPDESTIALFARSLGNALNAIGGAIAGTIVTAITGSEQEGINAGKNFGAITGQALGIAVAAAMFSPVRTAIGALFGSIFFDELQGNARRIQSGLFGMFNPKMTNAAQKLLRKNILYAFTVTSRLLGVGLGLSVSDYIVKALGVDSNSLEALGIKIAAAIGGAIALGFAGPAFLSGLAKSRNSILVGLTSFVTGISSSSGAVGLIAARAILAMIARGFFAYSFIYSEIGKAIIENIANGIMQGAGDYSEWIQGALLSGVIFGPRLISAFTARFGLLGYLAIFALVDTLADTNILDKALADVGFGAKYADSMINAIIIGLASKRAGLPARIAVALGLGAGLADAVSDHLEETTGAESYWSRSADVIVAGLTAAITAAWVTKNPYAIIAAGLAAGFAEAFRGVNWDEAWNDLVNNKLLSYDWWYNKGKDISSALLDGITSLATKISLSLKEVTGNITPVEQNQLNTIRLSEAKENAATIQNQINTGDLSDFYGNLEWATAELNKWNTIAADLATKLDPLTVAETERTFAILETTDALVKAKDEAKEYADLLNEFGTELSPGELDAYRTALASLTRDIELYTNRLNSLNVRRDTSGDFSPVGRRMATGGWVSGPGTGTSDSIPAMLSNGEFVINAKATKKFLPLLEMINSGNYGYFANGGLPGPISGGTRVTDTPARLYSMDPELSTVDNLYINRVDNALYERGLGGISDQLVSDIKANQNVLPYDTLLSAGLPESLDSAVIGLMKSSGYIAGYSDAVDESGEAASNANGEVSTSAKEAADKIKKLKEQLKSLAERAIEMTTMNSAYFAEAGVSGAETMLQSFKDNLGGFLKGEFSFKDMVGNLLDTFTSKVIENFSDSLINSLFNKFDLTSLFGNAFTGVSQLGAKAGGGVLAPNATKLMQGGVPVFVMNMPLSGGLAGNTGPAGTTGNANNWFSKMFSGISNFFTNIFSGIGSIFSGLFGGGGGGLGSLFSLFSGRSFLGGWATGGYVSGPGGPTSDSIMAMLSNGEYVINAATTKRWRPFLEVLNSNDGKLPAFANGGLVGPANSSAFKTMQENNNKDKQQQVFNINVTGDVSMQTRKEIARMIPEITSGVNMTNRERGSR